RLLASAGSRGRFPVALYSLRLHTRDMNTTPARKINCHKCSGTGTVERFLDYEGGICFDCNGTGRIAHVSGSTTKQIRVNVADLAIGLRVRATNKANAETVVDFRRHPELPIVTVATTDAGNEYLLNPNFQSPLVYA